MVFKALLGNRSRDDVSSRGSVRRKSSTTGGGDSRTSSRRQSKISSASSVSSSRRSTRGDDRDRGLGDISASRSVTGDSTTTYVTAEPTSYVDEPLIIERTPRSDRGDDRQRTSRDTDRDSKRRSERRYTEERSSRDDTNDRDRTRPRTKSEDTAAHFAAEISDPRFNQFPMQYDSSNIPGTSAPYHPPLDSHIPQQFPGQLPDATAQPYMSPNPAGYAADYYNDQGQSVAHQPGVRPQAPDIIVGSQPHLHAASAIANPPPEPSSLGQVGAAAEYYAAGDSFPSSTTPTSSKPPKPSKPSKTSSRPPKPTSGVSIAGESTTFGIGSELMNQASSNFPITSGSQSMPLVQATGGTSSSHNGVGLALGGAAAGAAAAYMLNHHNDQSNSNMQYANRPDHHNDSYGIGIPPSGNINSSFQGNLSPYAPPGYANRPPLGPSYASGGMQPGSLAYHQQHHGPLSAFIDFWRDPEGVGKFEEYTEAIGVCKYCFEPGTSSRDAPRKHHYNRRRRSPVVDRYGSSSRVDKLTRYNSSEDESRRKKSKGSSWLAGGLAGGLAGYVAKSLFSNKDFEDTYSVSSGTRVESSRRHTYDEESMVSSSKASSTSRGVISKKRSSDDKGLVAKDSKSYRYSRRSSRSRSRSTSRDRRTSSGLKEAAIGAAVGSALTAAATRSSERNRSPDRSIQRHRRRQSDSSGSVNFERSRRRGRSSPRGFRSFFTAPSANRRKKSSKKERGFFSFGNSSSSSGDFDLAFGGSEIFGSTVSGRSSRSNKSSKKHNVDAEILGLGLAARQLAHSSSRKEISPRDLARPPNYARPTKVEDDGWEDADSSDSSVSANLAYGGSAIFGSQEPVTSGSSFWPWGSSSRKQNKTQRQYPQTPPTNDYSYYPTDYASQDGSSGRGSLQQVYPVPTSDPSRFDVVRMSTSSSPNVQPPLVRPGPIPLQQPQPVTPVSQSVYYPTVTAPIDPLVQRIGLEDHTSRDIQRHRRSNSSPVLPIAPLDGPSPGILKRRSTAKDPATVSFDLTEEQTDRQQEVDRRDKERLERRREEEFAVLREEADELAELERRRERKEKRREERRRREEAEAEEAAREARRERRRKESKVDDRPSVSSNGERKEAVEELTRKDAERKETSSSSWVTPAIVGAGAAAVAGVLAEKAFEDDGSSASTSRYEERREKRRSERRSASETQSEVTEAPRQEQTQQVVEDDEQKKQEQRIARIAASRIVQHQSPTAHESYEDFFMPEDLRHHESHDDSSPNIIEVVPRSERAVEPYLGSDLDKPDPSWPPLVINIIKPTPPGSYDGSVRDVHSPVPTSEPTEKEKEPKDDVESTPSRPTTGSRVSWGEHQTHEYEVETPISDREEHFEETDQHEAAVSSEHREDVKNYEIFAEEKPVPRHVDETESDSKHSMPGSFDDDVEFAATLAAGAEIAGFDPAVVTDDASYYSKDHLSKASFKDTYRPPAVESVTDLGDANSVFSASARKDFRKPESFDFQNAHTEEKASSQAPSKTSQDVISGTRSIAVTEPEDVDMSEFLDRQLSKELRDDTGDSVPLSPVGDESQKTEKSKRRSKTLEDFDIELEEHLRRSASNDNPDSKRLQGKSSASDDVDFEATLKRVQSAPVTDDWIEEDKERRRRKSKRSSLNRAESVDDARSVAASAPGADELEEYRSRGSSRRSKNDDEGDLEDDTRSLPDADDDGERRRRRKHKRHSGNFDDAASVASSPAKIDETREKRRSRDSSTASKERSKEPEKKSGGLFSSIFGSKTNPERSSSTSGKRETQSEVGVEDRTSERRRKKRSSSGRSVSGDGAGEWDVASEAALSTMDRSQLGKALDGEEGDNDSQSSRRKRREKRRDRYEGIVDSARDTSEKERYTTADDNDDDKMSFLGMRPEMPPVNSHEEDPTREIVGGASGLAITAAGLEPMISHDSSLEDQLQVVQQRLRSRSVSPSTAEKTFELAPRSQSRPSSPGGNQEEKDLRARRLSLLRTNDSPTAVPLHFRKPPTSPNSSRRVSMTSPAQSPSSPKPGHRRPNSVEFKNVREIRPLWLVERHSTSKLDVEPEGPLPSLPSSKTSSRSPSVENLREGFDEHEDAVTGFFMGGDSAYNWGRKPVDLRISTDRTPPEDEDFLNSQQATPTAETYNNKAFGPPPIKKEKPKYEFHSPSELLQDPTTYQSIVPQLPESLDRLPSVAGSDLGVKEPETKLEGAPIVESVREVEEPLPSHNTKDEDQSEKQKSGMSSFLAGAGFASVVDAAVSAAVSDREPVSNDIHEYEAASKDLKEEAPHHSMIEDASNQEQAPSSKPQSVGDFGDVVDAAVAAAVSEHASHNEIHTDRDQSMKAEEGHVAEDVAQEHNARGGGLFAGVVDAAVAAAAAAAAAASGETHAEVAQPELAEDVELREDTAQDQKTEEIPTAEPSTEEESKVVAEEATTEPSSGSTSKKQKRKDKKKKKKSKDLDVTAEDNDEQETVAVPAVELDSSAQPKPEAEAEAERAEPTTELTNQLSTVAEQQPVSDGTEVKDDALEIPSDQPLTGVSEEVVEDNTREIQPSTSNVEIEAVTASAENEETQPGPSAEPTITTTTTDTNDQSPHVAAEPEEDGATAPSKSSKKKKKNKKKSQSLSESGSVDIPATPVEESQIDASVTVTEEPQAIYEVAEEKPAPETSSTSMPSENLETTEDVSTSEEKQQIDENEPGLSESTERSVVDKDDAVADTTEQDAQGTLGIEQEKSLNSPVDEWFDPAETAKTPPTELAEAAQDATDKEIPAPEVSQDTAAITELVETKQVEEPAATTSSSKKKNKKKKNKGQSQSVDESTSQEIAQVPSETVLSQPDSAEVPSVATEGEVAQPSDADGQSKDIGESIVEEARQEVSDSLTSEVEQVPQKSEEASTSAVREAEPTTADAENVTEAAAESESLPSAPVPEHNEETVELQASDIPVEPISSETLQSEGDAVPPEQSTKDNEAAGVIPKEEEVSLPSKEASDEVSGAPVKSKKKKGKKGKRVSWAEEPELATESEPVTPAEPDTTPASEDTTSAVVSEDPFPTVGEETTIPVSAEPESSTIPEDVPQEVERDMLTPAEPVDSAPPLSTDVEPTPTSEASAATEAQKEPSTEPQPEQQIQGVESLDDQPVSLPSESSQPNDAKELSEEANESQAADSKSKRKKDKKKDKKKKKAAESSLLADEEPSQPSESPVNQDTKDVVEDATPEVSVPVDNPPTEQPVAEEQTTDTVPPDTPEPQAPEMPEPIDLTPAEQPIAEGETTDVTPADAPEATESTESTPVDQSTTEERPSDAFPEHASAPEAPEAPEPSELTPVDQPTAEEQTSGIVPEDASEPQTPKDTVDEVKPADRAQDNDDELAQETSKSKKKKDKKKKKAAAAAAATAAALSVDQDPSDPPLTEEAKEAAEIVVSDNADQTKDTTVEQSNSDDLKEVSVVEPVAEPQILEEAVEEPAEDAVQDPVQDPVQEPIQEPVDELMQESIQETVEEAKLVDPADNVPAQETSKSKKKKDKKKKKAAEALLQDEEPAPKEETADPTASTSSVAPEQTESVPQEQQLPDEPKTEDVIAAENEERRPLEVPAEEVKPTEAVVDDEWAQETSKSKNKKDKKKKKAAAALSVDEESTPSETVVEEAEAKPSEAEALIPQDQPILDEETAGITENQDAEPRPVEVPAEEVKSTEVAEDDEWAQETSKSKKRKDKRKKKAAEALSLSEEPAPPSETVVEEVQEKPTEVEDKPDVSETQEERILNEEKKDVTEDLNAEPQANEEPAEDVKAIDNAEDDGLVQETSSKSKKKKDKKKKKAEALSWDDEPQTPVKEELAEAAETVLLQAQDMPAVEEQQSGDVSKDEDAKPETTDNPVEDVKAVAVAEEDELAQETSSKSKKKKDKKKKKAAEALPWDEEPASSDRPIDEQAPADAEPSASQAQEDSLVDDKKPDDATEVQSTETPIPETPTEEMKQVDTPEDDNSSQDTSKSKKKKDKKKNRKSLQLEVAQEENTPDVTVGETKDILGTTPEVEPTSVSEDVTAAVDEQKEADTADVQSQAAPQDELVPVQAESIEDETSTSKSGKSKKKKGKKNKSKDEPIPWDEEPSVKTSDSQQETSADQPTVTEISPVQESARENLEPTEQDELEPKQPIQQPLEPTEEISKDTGLSASTEVEASERTLPTELEQLEQSQLPTDTPVSVQPEEPANQNPLNATELAESEPPAKSGKKSKKKKKRESMLLDDESTEQQDSPTIPIAVNGEDQTTIEDSLGQEEQPEPTPTGEVQPQQETGVIESKDPDSTDANVDPNIEDSGAAVIEPIKQLSAKEKRKEKKKKRRTLDLADSEPNPAIADEVPKAAAPVEQSLPDEQQKDDEGAPDEFAVVGKKKGKKSKKQSVSWEDEVIQAVAEDDTKPDKTGDPEHAQVTEEQQLDSDSKNPPLSEHTDLDSGPSQTENELQETPVEVEGKQTFQSSEETYTDQREKDFDWTDNMVSPQVQSQTEESLFPVPSPISDEREDPDQSRPTTVDDSQSHETVIPETVVEDQPAASEQEREGPTEISPADVQVIDQETEDIDWTASKSSKKNKKKKKQKSIDTVPDDSMIAAEETSSKTPVEEDEKPEFTEQQVVNTEPLETIQEQSVVQDEPLVSEPEPQMEVNVEEEFKPVGSSKKKGKKNKKKSDTWPSEELGEPASDQNTEEAPARSPNDIVEGETIATDNDKIQMPEDTPLPPETAQEEVVEDTTSKDAPEILSEVPDDTPLVTETVQEEVVEDTISKDAIVIPDEVPDNTPLVTGIAQEEVVEDTTSKDAIVIPDEVPDNTPLITETPQEGVVEDTTSKDAPEILSEVPENAPLAPETVQEGVVEDMTSKDVTEIPLEVPENAPVAETVQEEVVEDVTVKDATVIPEQGKSLPQEGFPESEATPFPEPPTRKLSKKEKRKMKKGKKAGFEEEEPAADIVEKEQAETVLSEHVPEATEEKGDSVSAADDTLIVIDKSTDIQPMIEEATTTTEEPQVSDANVETTPVQEESLARKPSKKEKRKNKKRMTEDRPEEEPLEASTADNAGQPEAVELITTDGQEKNPDGDFATEASLSGEQPEHVHVSLDPFDVPEAEDEGPNNPSADLVIDNDLAERVSEPELDAEAALRARQLEKEADLAVAASLFGESPEPEPEQVISRQLSKKQKGKKNKKDKKNVPVEKETSDDTAVVSQTETPPKEGSVQEERHETKPSGSIEEISRSWPSVEFDNDLSQTYSTDKNAHKDNELEPERQVQHSETSVQDPASIIDDFRVEETHEEAPRLKSDIQPVDMEEASQQGHRSHSPSQKEDVDMIISATMAAAGFLPSAVTAPAGADAFTETKSTSGTSRELSDIYEHRDVFSDNQMHSKSSHTTLETSEGGSKSSKIANIFPGLERVKYREPSPKLHEKQAENTPTVEERKLPVETPVKIVQDTQPTHHVSSRELPVTEVESTSKDRSSSLLFDSSPSTRLEPTPDTTRRASSSQIRLQRSNDSLHRTKSIHGQRSGRTHSWQLEDDLTPTKRASSQSPRPLLHPDHLDLSPPRTPLDPIKEHLPSPSPRLLMGEGPYKLERPDSRASVRSSRSLRRTNRSISGDLRAAASLSSQASHDWSSADVDTDGHKKGKAGRQDVGHPQPLNPQRRRDNFHSDNNHLHSDDDDDFDRQHLENIPSSSKYDPVTDKGKRPVRGMSDVYEGWGETPNSPRSPTRPPSIRRRQSMQHLQELETRLDQLISENRLLAAAKEDAEKKLSRVGVARRKSDQALNTSNADLRDKEAEIARLTGSLEWMQSEVQRLTQENEVVNAKHAELTASHAREVDSLRTRQLELASGMEGIVREQISAALAEKDAELRRLRDELAAARQAVQELQQQIVAATADDVLSIHDEDYFDNSCQRLCQHVQQWVLRFSKHSDLRRCRPLSEVRNTNVADRFDNAILDGSDIDAILADRVRRRDVFVAVVMAMVWEYVFTRYLFGMDREQRQKLKALEKQLSEIGPRRAVSHWRALTLTLLAKRPSFADQRVRDTEAVALEIMETLSQLLPPPQSAQSQLLESLRGVIRRAANLSIEMRTQRAEYVMLPPLQPEYDSQGDLARQVNFNASLMNERSGIYSSNEALEAQGTAVRLVLFPLVVKKGNDLGDGDEEIVVCPAQVLVAWPENEKSRERDRMSTLGNRSVSSVVPSVDMGNAI